MKKTNAVAIIFINICIVIGSLLGVYLMYLKTNTFMYEVIVGAVIGSTAITAYELRKRSMKKDHLPESDERVKQNLFKFIAIASLLLFLFFSIAIAALSLTSLQSINIVYLWILPFSYLWIVGIGGLLVRKL